MKLDESLRLVVDNHKPCIAIACAVRSSEDQRQVDAQTSVGISLKGSPAAHAITALVAIQTAYIHICRRVARQHGMTDQDLQNVVNEGVRQSMQAGRTTPDGGGPAAPGASPPSGPSA